MKTIVKMVFGSRLYGLHNETSDHDVKMIHLPSMEECLLMRAARNIQTKDEVNKTELESVSLQSFLDSAASGQSFAMDMLHSSVEHWQERSRLWQYIWNRREKFYTKKLSGSLKYARGQSSKYCIKADRMNSTKQVLESLYKMQQLGAAKLFQVWDDLPDIEFTDRGVDKNNRNEDKRYYEICGKKLQPMIAVSYAIEIVQRLYDGFGARVAAVAHLDQKEWKSISHSFRIGYQLLHIYKDGGYSYPLSETEFIRDVKFGKLNYGDDQIEKKLDDLLRQVENLAVASIYPESIDRQFLDDIVFEAYDYPSSN